MAYGIEYRPPRSVRLRHATELCGFEGCLEPAAFTTSPHDVESCAHHVRDALRDAEIIENQACQDAADWQETVDSLRATGY